LRFGVEGLAIEGLGLGLGVGGFGFGVGGLGLELTRKIRGVKIIDLFLT